MKKVFLIATSLLLFSVGALAQTDGATKLKKERLLADVKTLDISIVSLVSDSQGENKSTTEQSDLYDQLKALDAHLKSVVEDGKNLTHTYMVVHNRMLKMQEVLNNLNKTTLTPTGKTRVTGVIYQVKQITALTDSVQH